MFFAFSLTLCTHQARPPVTPQTNKAADRAALLLHVLAPVTRDDATVVTIGGDPCPALANRLLPGKTSIGCGQRRKGGAEDDCRGKYDLFRIGHFPTPSFCCVCVYASFAPSRSDESPRYANNFRVTEFKFEFNLENQQIPLTQTGHVVGTKQRPLSAIKRT
jgi:hypothetical protein